MNGNYKTLSKTLQIIEKGINETYENASRESRPQL